MEENHPAKYYLGNTNRDLTVLSYINKEIKAGKKLGNNVLLDEFFLGLIKKGEKIDLHFEDTLNPLSSELHDAIFNLQQNWLISKDSPISLTDKGGELLEDFLKSKS